MIIDKLCESAKYEAMHPGFKEAFEFLRTVEDRENGRYELSGGMYVMVMDVNTHAAGDGLFEAHQKYIDIQYLLSGHSVCVWAHTPELTVSREYDAEKDAAFFTGEGSAVPVSGGEFYILYPSDAHEPHQTHGQPSAYRAAVVKVPV